MPGLPITKATESRSETHPSFHHSTYAMHGMRLMDHWIKTACLACCVTLMVGCANVDANGQKYRCPNAADPRCAKAPPQKTRKEMQKTHVEVCNVRGSYRECYWVRRGELNRILREMGF